MKTTVRVSGYIYFDPEDVTNKHERQAKWKKMAMVMIDKPHNINSGWSKYYAWFFKKKGLILNPPLRGAHVTFIDDAFKLIKGEDNRAKAKLWERIKRKYNGKKVSFVLDLTPKTEKKIKERHARDENGRLMYNKRKKPIMEKYEVYKHWWLRVTPESRKELHGIRTELGLGDKKHGLHMTIGYANEANENIEQTNYLAKLIK